MCDSLLFGYIGQISVNVCSTIGRMTALFGPLPFRQNEFFTVLGLEDAHYNWLDWFIFSIFDYTGRIHDLSIAIPRYIKDFSMNKLFLRTVGS